MIFIIILYHYIIYILTLYAFCVGRIDANFLGEFIRGYNFFFSITTSITFHYTAYNII